MRLNYDCASEKTNRIYWQIHYVIRWSFIKKFIYNIYIQISISRNNVKNIMLKRGSPLKKVDF